MRRSLFASPAALKGRFAQALTKVLLDGGQRFGLHLDDVTRLLAEVEKEEGPAEPDQRHGAGKGGVILGVEP